VFVVALAALALLQLPPALRLRGTLRRRQAEREALLRRALASSELERRRIAAELHDGLVQQLAGLSYTLAASADHVRRGHRGGSSGDDEGGAMAAVLDDAAAAVRRDVREVRSIMVQIHPPNLAAAASNARWPTCSRPSRLRASPALLDTRLAVEPDETRHPRLSRRP
jgi:signal transduction histidine kinase